VVRSSGATAVSCATISTISTPGRRCPEAEANMAELATRPLRWSGLPAAAAAFSTLALAGTLVSPPRPLLLWNSSASSPLGLYAIERGRIPRVGEMAIAWPPRSSGRLAAIRNYLPARVPLVKLVAADAPHFGAHVTPPIGQCPGGRDASDWERAISSFSHPTRTRLTGVISA
jgi:hypothetical protein